MAYENDMQAVIDAAREGMRPEAVKPAENPYFMKADGTVVDLTKYLPGPQRKAGTVKVFDIPSLNTVIQKMGGGAATIYVNRDLNNPAIVAVMNDHGAEAGWRDFKAVMEFRHTPQWVKWMTINDKMLPQETFAEFIEANVLDVVTPDGASMLEIALTFQATKTASFKKAIRLDNGTIQFQNIENMDATAGARSEFEVPTKLELSLSPFIGVPKYGVPASFRYSLNGGSLKLGIKLDRLEELMEAVIGEMVRNISLSDTIYTLEAPEPRN